MSYQVKIYDRQFNELTTLTTKNFWDLEYRNILDKPGDASFKMRVRDVKATPTNIKLFNRIKIFKDGEFKWIGYITDFKASLDELEFQCIGALQLFKERNIAYATTPGQLLTDEFYKILNILINNVDDTGINQGTSTAISTLTNSVVLRDSDALATFKKLASFENKVININQDNELDLVDSIGTDKSNTVIFRFVRDQVATANLLDYNVDVDGKDMANSVFAKIGGIRVNKQDASSIATFGLRHKVLNNLGSTSSGQLDDEAQTYLDNYKQELITPEIKPNSLKIDPDSYDYGDTVRVVLDNGLIAINQKYLIIEKKVKLSAEGVDEVDIKVSPEGSNVLPSNFFEDIAEIKSRQSLIEGELLQ